MISDLNDKIRTLRHQRKLRQDHVATQIGVDKSTMSQYESGARRPSLESLALLADTYHVTTDYLLGRSEKKLIDASGLNNEQFTLICSMVALMTKENKRLEDLQK